MGAWSLEGLTWLIQLALLSVCPLSHCHKGNHFTNSLCEWLNKITAECVLNKRKPNYFLRRFLLLIFGPVAAPNAIWLLCLLVSLWQIPFKLQALYITVISCRLVTGLRASAGANRWVNDLVERQATEIIGFLHWRAAITKDLPEALLAVSLIISLPHWPVLFRRVGVQAASSVKCTQRWLKNPWVAHYFLHPPRDEWPVT